MTTRHLGRQCTLALCPLLLFVSLDASAAESSVGRDCRLISTTVIGVKDEYVWRGACVNGYADGEGVLTRTIDGVRIENKGLIRKGMRTGLWHEQWVRSGVLFDVAATYEKGSRIWVELISAPANYREAAVALIRENQLALTQPDRTAAIGAPRPTPPSRDGAPQRP